MTFTAHARPELSSHNRTTQSAVAGAAYRLGLRLFDERTGEWHDYRKRAIGEEIVRALTIAPAGAPPWATDPAELWNRVEKAEKRKDAQVARDYRIPIPKGLSDERAGELAERMARYICKQLHTPVSLGLHRDASVDVLGDVKADADIGFHAHLYFPTRRMADIAEGGEEGGHGFGDKLRHLSLKGPAAAFVEDLNREWAATCNAFIQADGLEGTFDHRSYVRMGVDRTPQPTAGRAVSAMERKGIRTDIGDAIRSHQPIDLLRQLVADDLAGRAIHGPAPTIPSPGPASRATRALPDAGKGSGAIRVRLGTGGEPGEASPRRNALVGGRTVVLDRRLSLAQLVRNAGGAPRDEADRQAVERAMLLADIIESMSIGFETATQQQTRFRQALDRAHSAQQEALYRADEMRVARTKARTALAHWEDRHRVQVRVAGWTGLDLWTAAGAGLARRARKVDGLVQTLKSEAATHGNRVAEARVALARAERKLADVEPMLIDRVRALAGLVPAMAPVLIERMPAAVVEAAGLRTDGVATQDPPTPATEETPSRTMRLPGPYNR
jgi:hypothetical protein